MSERLKPNGRDAARVIRERVVLAMDRDNITYYEACQRLGLKSVSRVHWLRNSMQHWPNPRFFSRLCEEFELDPEELLREAGYLA